MGIGIWNRDLGLGIGYRNFELQKIGDWVGYVILRLIIGLGMRIGIRIEDADLDREDDFKIKYFRLTNFVCFD